MYQKSHLISTSTRSNKIIINLYRSTNKSFFFFFINVSNQKAKCATVLETRFEY